MSDRFVNLQSQLRAVENNVEYALGTLVRAVQRDCLFADSACVLEQLEFVDELVSFVLPLAAERVRIRPLLNLAACERVGNVSRSGHVLCLMNVRAFRREEPLLLAPKI